MIFAWLLGLFIGLPILELALLLKVGRYFGMEITLALVIVTGMVGAVLARWQGLAVLGRIRNDFAQGRVPAPHLMDGVMILIAGALLVTPGLITDATGFLLLFPPFRRKVRQWLRGRFERNFMKGTIDVDYHEW